jgi:opacity protein-like surface antigen
MKKVVAAFILILSVVSFAWANTLKDEDLFIAGYIEGILKGKHASDVNVVVQQGHVYLPSSFSNHANYEEIVNEIGQIDGVKTITLTDDDRVETLRRIWIYPGESMIKPLRADLRWPAFSLGYRYYTEKDYYKNAVDVNLGKTFSLYRMGLEGGIPVELGLQAGVFSTFDLYDFNFDLVNSDFFWGVPITANFGPVIVTGRFYHQNTLDAGIGQRRIGYEALDGIVSFEPNEWFRLYGGLGSIITARPSTYGRMLYQAGVEFDIKSDYTSVPDTIIALNINGSEETKYQISWSLLLGLEIATSTLISLEFYDGFNNGWAYNSRVQWIGIGMHYY